MKSNSNSNSNNHRPSKKQKQRIKRTLREERRTSVAVGIVEETSANEKEHGRANRSNKPTNEQPNEGRNCQQHRRKFYIHNNGPNEQTTTKTKCVLGWSGNQWSVGILQQINNVITVLMALWQRILSRFFLLFGAFLIGHQLLNLPK